MGCCCSKPEEDSKSEKLEELLQTMKGSVAVLQLLIDDTIELMETIIKEVTEKKDLSIAKVTFPIVTLVDQILNLSFIVVVAVSVTMGDIKMETIDFSETDNSTFFAWRSDI